jgi:hypothetical protein
LSDDSQLEEVPDLSAIVGEVADEHEEVDEEQGSQVALLGLIAELHSLFLLFYFEIRRVL